MKQKAIKLVLSGAASLALAVSLTATTFAYVLIGNNVIVEEFSFDVEGQEGLLISLDGENYSQDITSEQLKTFIAGSVEDFNKRKLTGTTVKHNAGSAVYEGNYLSFEKEQINYIDASDTYERSYVGAIPNEDYLAFDLYFQALNTQTSATNFNLSFGEKTYIKSIQDDVKLLNGFRTWTYDDNLGYYVKKDYQSGDTVTQNVSNAMRMAIYNADEVNPLSVYEVTDDKDLGSAAINGKTDAKHDPYASIMINYYNSIFPRYPFVKTDDDTKKDSLGNTLPGILGAEDGEAFNTIDGFGTKNGEDFIGKKVGTFTTTDTLHIVVYIWLEGWDADFLLGTSLDGSKLSCGLEFNLTEA